MSGDLLKLDVGLLLLRYGKQRVFKALAELEDQSVEQLEQKIQEMRERPRPVKRSGPVIDDVLSAECARRPEIADALKSVAAKFQSRALLPNLRDVQRLLNRIGHPGKSLKSRTAAGPILIRALAQLPKEEVLKLIQTTTSPHESDFAVLSQAILGERALPKKPTSE